MNQEELDKLMRRSPASTEELLSLNEDVRRVKEWYEKEMYQGARDYALKMRDVLYKDPNNPDSVDAYKRLTALAAWCSLKMADDKKPETFREAFDLASEAGDDREGVGCLATILGSVETYTDDEKLRELVNKYPDNPAVVEAARRRFPKSD